MTTQTRTPAPAARPARAARATPRSGPEAEDERLARLPVWAQDEIKHLRRALTEARAERDALVSGTVPSDTAIDRQDRGEGAGPPLVYLPMGGLVRFFWDEGHGKSVADRRGVSVSMRRDGRVTHLALNSWSGPLAVIGAAGNAMNVVEVDRAP